MTSIYSLNPSSERTDPRVPHVTLRLPRVISKGKSHKVPGQERPTNTGTLSAHSAFSVTDASPVADEVRITPEFQFEDSKVGNKEHQSFTNYATTRVNKFNFLSEKL